MAEKRESSRKNEMIWDAELGIYKLPKVKIDVDCSETLTGLKAIQREAKKAIQVIRELEEVMKAVDGK